MNGGRRQGSRRAWPLLGALLLTAACATMEAPGGGPVDREPPRLAAAAPGSAAVGLRDVRRLELIFSEKVQPRPARALLRTYPPLEVRRTRWHHRQAVTVEFAEPLPPDTVVVVEVPPGITDVHRVRSDRGWQFPIATADSLPAGEITGRLLLHDAPVAAGVVELLGAAPDTSRGIPELPVWRRAVTDSTGRFRLPWLPVPLGPARLRAFADRDHDGRPGEREPQRTWNDTVRLTAAAPRLDAGDRILYEPTDPGTLLVACPDPLPAGGAVLAWTMTIGESDTGFVPAPRRRAPAGQVVLRAGATVPLPGAGPGLVRLIAFADQDGDSLLSAACDSTLPDTACWRWEPLAVVDSVTVEPGLRAAVTLPPPPWERLPAPAPAAADSDTTASAGTTRETGEEQP